MHFSHEKHFKKIKLFLTSYTIDITFLIYYKFMLKGSYNIFLFWVAAILLSYTQILL